ncbi:MAG TPA: autotransporter [Solirubrobacteraceae bacterium]|nr:autotransporter [Solirubrobacteraceae bacterium]
MSAATTLAAILALAALSAAYAADPQPAARSAATQNVKDEAHLHLTHTNGSLLIEEGQATGQIPGKIKASFEIEANVTSSFTIYARGGSLSGRGKGRLHTTGPNSSFGGTLKITGGTGRYKHAHGTGGFYGVINRKTYAVTVQTTGRLAD